MAKFEILQSEGMQWVKATLSNETVRAEKGALNHMLGDLSLSVPTPDLRSLLVAMISDESPFRPSYTGTGELHLEPSLGGFHVLQVHQSEGWVVENNAYWASEGKVGLSVARERLMTALWAGEGLLWYHTRVRGNGKVILSTPGPVEEIVLNNERLSVDGDYVVARTESVRFDIGRASKSRFRSALAGEGRIRTYHGTGKVLLSAIPYWRLRVTQGKSKDPALLTS